MGVRGRIRVALWEGLKDRLQGPGALCQATQEPFFKFLLAFINQKGLMKLTFLQKYGQLKKTEQCILCANQ